MKRSALPLVLGVYGLVRMCLRPRSRQALAKAFDLQQESFSVTTRLTMRPRLAGYTSIMDVPSELLRAACVTLNIGQRELAKLSGVGQRTILRIKRNDETVTLESRRRLQEAFEQAGITFVPDDGTSGPGLRVQRDLINQRGLRF